MTPEEALLNILKLVEGSDELEDARAMQILLQSIKTLAEKDWGALNDAPTFYVRAIAYRGGTSLHFNSVRGRKTGGVGGSYLAPWLFRSCGRPGDCSDDANSYR